MERPLSERLPRVTLDNRGGVSFDVEPGQTILDAAEEAGIPMISGCRVGGCRTCAARLIEGSVSMPQGTAMTAALVEAGVVLTCVATARADARLEVGRPGRPLIQPGLILPWTE